MPRTVRALLLGVVVLVTGALGAAPAAAAADAPARAACPGPFPLGTAHCHAEVVAAPLAGPAAPDGYAPADLWSAYGIALDPGDGLPEGGDGATVAIVGAYHAATAETDLAAYRAQFGLPACTTADGCLRRVNQRGDAAPLPAANASWGQEMALDLEMVSALCPRCRLLLVEADSNLLTDLAAAVAKAGALGATQITNSYGAPEYSSETVSEPAFDQPGVDITASSGDGGYGTEYPAASRYVTAVGGTRLVRAAGARGWAETAWSGAGSGCSKYIAKPAWQTDGGCARRSVADVSAVADPDTGVAAFAGGAWVVFGGTSVAAPIVAAVDALAGGRAPGMQRGRFPYDHPGAFHDVASGSNGSCGSYLCTARAGYDGPTGMGTPAGADDLLAPPPPAITAPADGAAGTVRDVTVAGTAEPGARIAVLDGETPAGAAVATAGGAWTVPLTGLADGVHVLRATATDAAGNASARSAAVTIAVDGTPPAPPVLAAPADGALVPALVTVTGTAEPGALVRVRADDAPAAQATADGTGAWSAPLTGLADGEHVLTATAADAAGNVSVPSAGRTVTVDGTPPETQINDGPAGDGQAPDAQVAFSSDDPAATFACRLDAGAWAPCASPLALAGLAGGAHRLDVRARDAAGNEDPTPASREWTVGVAAGPAATPRPPAAPAPEPPPAASAPPAAAPAGAPDVAAAGVLGTVAQRCALGTVAGARTAGRLARDRRARGLTLACAGRARLTLSARVRIAGRWRPVVVGPRSVLLAAAGTVRLRVLLGPRTARALRAARRGRLAIVVRDPAGSGRTVLTRTLRG